MPSVFLSYSRADLPLIEQLEARLTNPPSDLSIWRDQEKIRGGAKWPKVLGEAIADQDVFLLAWSKNSATSHFVEFEWCTAIALKKTIVPCLLDDTPLAASLRTFHGYQAHDVAGLLNSLRAAPPAESERRAPVLRKLNEITTTEEKAVVEQVKAIFAQQQWTVQGNVYQAGGDIHITQGAPQHPDQEHRQLKAWALVAGLIVSVLTIAVLIPQVPKEWGGFISQFASTEKMSFASKFLNGQVFDECDKKRLPDVMVSTPGSRTVRSDSEGHFQLEVQNSPQDRVRFFAEKDGYDPYSGSANLGETISFYLSRPCN